MIVVTGATGNVGQPLVRTLVAAGEKVIAVSRRPSDVDGARQADLTSPQSLPLDGADALFLLVVGDDPDGLLDFAKAADVRKVVLLSSLGAATRPESYRTPREFEDAVRASGLAWTILRPSGFASNALRWAESVRTRRTVAAPFADVALPVVDPADIAEVAAAALRGDHAGRAYELTGPEPVSPRQQAATIADALGTPVRFVEQVREEARTQLVSFLPEPVVESTLDILGEPSARERRVSPDVERLLGRPPCTFADWLTRNLAAFR